MKEFKLKIGSSEFDIDEKIFNCIKDYYEKAEAEPERAFIFNIEKEILSPIKKIFVNYRFFKRKKRITKNRFKNIRNIIKFN